MKMMLLSVALLFSAAMMAQTSELVIKTEIYCDHCAKCGDCKPKIENALLYTKGVKFVELNVEEESVKVTYNAKKTTPDELRQALAGAGFRADDVPADAVAHSKLDGCCRKKD